MIFNSYVKLPEGISLPGKLGVESENNGDIGAHRDHPRESCHTLSASLRRLEDQLLAEE